MNENHAARTSVQGKQKGRQDYLPPSLLGQAVGC
jgi:hypothetical protein